VLRIKLTKLVDFYNVNGVMPVNPVLRDKIYFALDELSLI